MPTGTLVEIKFVQWPYNDDWQLNVEIFPSPSDVGTTSGLCGVLDGDYKNDFTRSDDTVDSPHLTYPDDFSESWRYILSINFNSYSFSKYPLSIHFYFRLVSTLSFFFS